MKACHHLAAFISLPVFFHLPCRYCSQHIQFLLKAFMGSGLRRGYCHIHTIPTPIRTPRIPERPLWSPTLPPPSSFPRVILPLAQHPLLSPPTFDLGPDPYLVTLCFVQS